MDTHVQPSTRQTSQQSVNCLSHLKSLELLKVQLCNIAMSIVLHLIRKTRCNDRN